MKLKFLLLAVFGFVWFLRFQTALPKNLKEGQRVRISGTLGSEPEVLGGYQSFSLVGIRVKAERFPEFHWGDNLAVTGRIKIQEGLFLREYWLEEPRIEKQDIKISRYKDIKSRVIGTIFSFRERIVSGYRRSLPEPAASLLAGIVLGEKSALPSDFWQALRKTGTLHIVVASGANITFLAGFLMAVLPFLLSRKFAYLLTIILIWFYVFLAGGGAPIFRAGIMGTIAYFGLSLGKKGEALGALIFAAGFLLLLRPLSLFDLGFQLSFAVTLGIILLGNQSWGLIAKLPGGVKQALKTTLSAQVFTLPIITLNFGTLPWLSPVANILVYWTVPILMGLGAAAGVAGLVWEPAGRLFCLLSFPLLEYFIKTVKIF